MLLNKWPLYRKINYLYRPLQIQSVHVCWQFSPLISRWLSSLTFPGSNVPMVSALVRHGATKLNCDWRVKLRLRERNANKDQIIMLNSLHKELCFPSLKEKLVFLLYMYICLYMDRLLSPVTYCTCSSALI